MPKERPRIADLYTNLYISRDRVIGIPPETRSIAEQLLAKDIGIFMQYFSLVGIDLDSHVAQNALVNAVGGDTRIKNYPSGMPQTDSVQSRLTSFIEFMGSTNYVLLSKENFHNWNTMTQDKNKPVGVILYLSDLYKYKNTDEVIEDITNNNISMVEFTWVVNHPVFGCAQRSTDTQFDTGLTKEGKILVEKLLTLPNQPIIIDLAHLSDKSMHDLLSIFEYIEHSREFRNKGLIYSHGGARELYPGYKSGISSQNIKDSVLKRLAELSVKNVPVLVQVMPWKGTYASSENWESIADFKQLLLQHVLHMQRFGLPVALTSDWSINPSYRNQFITSNGPLGQMELFDYLKSKMGSEFAIDVVKNNAHDFIKQVFS